MKPKLKNPKTVEFLNENVKKWNITDAIIYERLLYEREGRKAAMISMNEHTYLLFLKQICRIIGSHFPKRDFESMTIHLKPSLENGEFVFYTE